VDLNVFAVVVLAALLLEYGLGTAASLLNLRALDPAVPPAFRNVYDPERYRRSQQYTRVRTRFGLIASTIRLAALLVFWWAGGFAWLDRAIRALEAGPLLSGLLFIGALALAAGVLGLPFAYFSTFVIEERFGFNRSTRRTFWTDVMKSALLALVLGTPLLAAVLLLFERAGSIAWLWCWAVAACFTVLVQFVAPAWILPLFNKYRPLSDDDLRRRIFEYADRVGFPLRGLFVVDGSRRSTKANAFFTGLGRNRRIALFDTLIERHSADEIVAVLAHEIGHYKKRHVTQGLLVTIAHAGVVFFLLGLFLRQDGLYRAFGVGEPSVYAGLVFFGLLYTPIELVLGIAMNAWSRRNEYEADRYAAETTGRARDLAAALKRLSADALVNLTPHPVHVALHASHPPITERLARLDPDGAR